jgi:hypothetical protein
MKRSQWMTWSFALACFAFTACAAGDSRFTAAEPAGFWTGIWHGLIAPIAFVVGLFSDSVEIYERTNTGAWYDFGYLIGMCCLGAGSHASRRTKEAVPSCGPDHVTIDVSEGAKPVTKLPDE